MGTWILGLKGATPPPWHAPGYLGPSFSIPPPNWKITDRPGFKTVFLTQKKIFDESGAVCSAEALTFQGGPAQIGPET